MNVSDRYGAAVADGTDATLIFLGPPDSPGLAWLRQVESVRHTADRLTPEILNGVSFALSFGYRHIIRKEVLDRMTVVNVHVSLLPWNRGADPNLWSWVDGTPKGVTIHYVDEGIDTGDVIYQEPVTFGEGETLATSYAKLQGAALALLQKHWAEIRSGRCQRTPQRGQGSSHRLADKAALASVLAPLGWDTPVKDLRAHFTG